MRRRTPPAAPRSGVLPGMFDALTMPRLLFEAKTAPAFDGETYEPTKDHERLGNQALRVFNVMRSGRWMTLADISAEAVSPESSVSARIRDFRKPRFGGHEVERRRRTAGLFEYRLVVNPKGVQP